MFVVDETWPDLGEYFASESLAVVPFGSTEQHSPHLSLSTDRRIAEALACEATSRTGHLRTPTVSVGVSPHHRQFHGTMWVDAPQFRDYVESLTRNLTYRGIDRVVFVNAHRGTSPTSGRSGAASATTAPRTPSSGCGTMRFRTSSTNCSTSPVRTADRRRPR